MRPKTKPAGVLAGALSLTITAAAVPAAAAAADTPVLRVGDRTIEAGERVTVRGAAPGSEGRAVVLEHRAATGAFTRIGQGVVRDGGRFRFRVAVPRSGVVRAAIGGPAGGAAAAVAAPGAHTNEQRVSVRRDVRVGARRLHVKAGRSTAVAGRVAPRTAGVPVKLQVRRGGHWATLDRGRTRAGGRYRLAERVSRTGSASARIVTGGGEGLARGAQRVGRLNVYRYAHVSWYGPGLYGNSLGCGGTLHPGTLGVAHKSLPCGTKVTLRRGDRSVRVRVIDRGPYVGGREYDLTQATAQRLGFTGHGSMLVTR